MKKANNTEPTEDIKSYVNKINKILHNIKKRIVNESHAENIVNTDHMVQKLLFWQRRICLPASLAELAYYELQRNGRSESSRTLAGNMLAVKGEHVSRTYLPTRLTKTM